MSPTVLITAFCPECQSKYQLKADLRGRKMRCPNTACQAVFVVREASSGPPRDGVNGPRAADSRGELVVPLTGDVQPRGVRSPAPVEELDWRAAPPPVQAGGVNGSTADRVAALGNTETAQPIKAPVAHRPPQPPPARIREWEQPAEPPRRGRFILLGFTLITAGLAGFGIWYGIRAFAHDEETRQAAAAKDYADGKFQLAEKEYRELATQYGRSEHAAEYRFLAELSDLQNAVSSDPAAALAKAEAFAKQFDTRDPQFKDKPERRKAVTDSLTAIASAFADAAGAAASADDGEKLLPPLLEQGQQTLTLLSSYGGTVTELRVRFDQANEALAAAMERRQAIAEVLKLLQGPSPDVAAARRLAIQRRVADDPIIRQEIERVENARIRDVRFESLNRPPQPSGPLAGPPVLLLETATGPVRPTEEVVLAVARGLLYAMDARDGRRLWACRVGLDAGDLPVRIRANGDDPELILVAASDPPGLTARNARTGAVVWHQPLDAPPLGRPVQDAGRLFAPTTGLQGFVYDLDPRSGIIRGRFAAHQRLAGGGAFDPATQRLYVPAHGQGVFVFSFGAEGPKCEGLLRTNHPAGSLRGEPIVVSAEEGLNMPRYLVLGQADGLEAMTLRSFRLSDVATAAPRQETVRIPGWSWFPPYHDPETIALVTDAGAIGLFGILQAEDADPDLFPLLGDIVSARVATTNQPVRQRGQLVEVSESGFWVLADGVLRHWGLGLSRRSGRQLTPAIGDGVRLGSPLHTAQVSADRRRLFLVTQSDSPPANRATAIDAFNGEIIWQRPLGLAAQGDPVALGGMVIVLDQSGAPYRFDPAQKSPDANDPWQAGGREIAQPADDLVGTPYLLAAADGQSAWAILVSRTTNGESLRLTLRRIAADGTVTSISATLPAPLAGTPALGPNAVVLPLANGQLCRVTLDAEPKVAFGPTWRARGARPDARGHVVYWKGDEYLVSDGGRQLSHVIWPTGPNYKLDVVELTQRLVGVPTRLQDGSVAVADIGGTVTLFRGDRPTVARTWRLGPITAGPWAVGDKLAVIVDRRKLVYLNPEADAPLWNYDKIGDGVESPPRLIDGKLVLADLAGRFVALDPATGKTLGAGYQFPAEAAPAAAVTAFGLGRLFAPLTDGTVLLLPMAEMAR